MSPQAKIDLPLSWQTPVDVAAVVRDAQTTQVAAFPFDAVGVQAIRPEEPTSLVLALIGAGAVVAFRGVKRVGGKAKASRRKVLPMRPQRRAA